MFSSNASQVSSDANYIEDVFSTWLYTGNGATQTITNGIDLAGKGGLVWAKSRTEIYSHILADTLRGVGNILGSNTTNASTLNTATISSFSSSGFSLGNNVAVNNSGQNFVSWTFRKQPKFFDVVTFTSDGTTNQAVSHSLGSAPGCIFIKRTDAAQSWIVWHRGNGTTNYYTWSLNNTAPALSTSNLTALMTSTSFQPNRLDDYLGNLPVTGGTYVAYLFAHNAGGFGLTGTDNVISCGSYTGNGSANGPEINLGYEPQWLLTKRTDLSADWQLVDTMRGMASAYYRLFPNMTAIEDFESDGVTPTATGFKLTGVQPTHNASGGTYIYIAIRRGPMKVPTTGTSVFGLNARAGTGANATVTGSAGVSDAVLIKNRGAAVGDLFASRLTGTGYLETSSSAAEVAAGTTILQANPWDVMDGVKVGTTSTITNASANTYINYLFDRAPGFFDEVCYTGTGANQTLSHNLQAVPELIIVKNRSGVRDWGTGWASIGWGGRGPALNSNEIAYASVPTWWNSTAPTASAFTVGSSATTNGSGSNFVAYLFATCAGVSKVGSYTGTGTTLQINCGFTGGARFVLIKRTDSTGDWYVWDSARGIVAGNDPYLLLNSTAAEVTTTDYIDTFSSGFEISSTAPAAINASGGAFIFLAIA